MDDLFHGMARFRAEVFPLQQPLYQKLATDGQQPQALVISCADSRVVPELITQSGPGQIFCCRNAGNIVPPFSQANGGVSSAIEYAVVALGVRDIVVCGHSDCGAMKALLHPEALRDMPNVAAWLRHSHAAHRVVCEAYPPDRGERETLRSLALENVVAQLNHLRTHPSVASRIAQGRLRLHGWFFELETGEIHAYDGAAGRFGRIDGAGGLPVALPPMPRLAAE
ncbi:carbonic anhydrase [Inquilinus sp. OTU3971]|uniref:carbonic anhydrase n=1 Tax=Inquilinus sp. OTU3971 TaxID=3043855 RepID=UPI00313E614B